MVKKHMKIHTDPLVSREVLPKTRKLLLDMETRLFPGKATKFCATSCERAEH